MAFIAVSADSSDARSYKLPQAEIQEVTSTGQSQGADVQLAVSQRHFAQSAQIASRGGPSVLAVDSRSPRFNRVPTPLRASWLPDVSAITSQQVAIFMMAMMFSLIGVFVQRSTRQSARDGCQFAAQRMAPSPTLNPNFKCQIAITKGLVPTLMMDAVQRSTCLPAYLRHCLHKPLYWNRNFQNCWLLKI